MTKNTKCHDCKIRNIDVRTQGRDSTMCSPCFEYAGWENTHTDENHHFHRNTKSAEIREELGMNECPICHPELDPRTVKPARSGHSNKNAAGPHFDHSMCAHESTKSARAKCRKQQRDNKPADVECPTCHANVTKGEKCMTRTGKIAKQSHNDRPSV